MRSWLYVPADKPKMIINAGIYGADGIVFDLEDSIGDEDKDQARILLAEAVGNPEITNDGTKQPAVRINDTASVYWQEDLKLLVPAGYTLIRLPKIETCDEIRGVSELLNEIETSAGIASGSVKLQVILETPKGIENAMSIAVSSTRIRGLSFGAEDFCSATGISRSGPAFALDYPRSRVVCAAAAAGIESWDTVWADFRDLKGLAGDAGRAKTLGFSGKSVIHPSQIDIVNRVFSPTKAELEWAERITASAGSESGVYSLDGMMIDKPVIMRAKRILKYANKSN